MLEREEGTRSAWASWTETGTDRSDCTPAEQGSFRWTIATGAMRWSPGIYSMLEYDPAIAASFDLILQRVHFEDIASFGQALDRALRQGAEIETTQRLVMPDGTVRHLRMVAQACGREAGAPRHYVGALIDDTRAATVGGLAEARAELASLSRALARARLAAALGHEAHTPLTAMAAHGEAALRWLDRDEPDLEEARRALSGLLGDAHRAGAMLARMLQRL